MSQESKVDDLYSKFAEELSMLMDSDYWEYVDQENQIKILSLLEEYKGQNQTTTSDCIS